MTSYAVKHQQGNAQSAAELRQQIDAQVRARVEQAQARVDAQQARLEAEQAAREARLVAEQAARDARLEAEAAVQEVQARGQGRGDAVTVVPPGGGGPNDIPREAVAISVAFFVMIAIIVIGLPIVRAFTRRMERSPNVPAIGPEMAAQIQRIEHTVESMAVELERISEAQRFSAKLEAERSSQPALSARPAHRDS